MQALSARPSEEDGHRRKRHAVNPQELQQRVSKLVGRQLDDHDMSRIFPSFPDLSLPDGARFAAHAGLLC